MIDIHCHLLPGIDDGPATLEAALALARACVADGITHAVLTPHLLAGRWENTRSRIGAEHARFEKALQTLKIPLQLAWAGEVRLGAEVLDWLAQGELPLLGGEDGPRCLLLEMPDGQIPLGADKLVLALRRQGITPVIAHPERNRAVAEQPERLRPFIEAGCRTQLTAASVVGQFGSRAQGACEALLERGWAHCVASDAHNLTGRAPRMSAARQWLTEQGSAELAHELTVLGPARLCGWPAAVPRPAAPSQPARHHG